MQSELWQRIYAESKRMGHPNPEKMADTAVRCRERALQKQTERAAVVRITSVPHVQNKELPDQKKPAPYKEPKCKARTLEGKQCPFKCMAGEPFCKKHCMII